MRNDIASHSYRKYQKRKVEHIVGKTYQAFHDEIASYGTLSAEEILEIGINIFENLTIRPLQRMSSDQHKMREAIIYQIAAKLGANPDEIGN